MARDDEPSGEGLIPIDETPDLGDGNDLRDPLTIAIHFYNAGQDPAYYLNALEFLTTPESHEAWGDFSGLPAVLTDLHIATGVHQALGPDMHPVADVVYVKLVEGLDQDHSYVTDGEVLVSAQVLTLVWRPEHERWMVHGIGAELLPEEVPRSSPGVGP